MRGPLLLIFCAVATLVIFFGGTWLYFQALAELLILAAALWAFWRGEIPERNPRLYILPGLLLLVPVLQLIPLPLAWLLRCSPELGRALADLPRYGIASPAWHSLSYNPYNTETQLLWLFTLIMAFLVMRRAAQRDPQGIRFFVAGLLALAAAVTLYGLYEWRNPDPYILWLPRRFYRGDVAGTYVNHNHYAGMIELILPLGLAWALDRLPELPAAAGPWPRRLRERLRQGVEALPGRLPLLAVCGLLIAGDVASHSRGGQISLAMAVVLLLLVRFARTPRRLLTALAVLLMTAGIFVKAVGVDEDQARFDRMQTVAGFDSGGRIQNWKATLPLVPKHWLLGTGLGTWEDATLRDQVTGLFDHAHNDYLEFALTGGVGFVALLFGAGIVSAVKGLRKGTQSRQQSWLALGIGTALCAILLHSLVDFNLQIPANALLATTVIAGCPLVSRHVIESVKGDDLWIDREIRHLGARTSQAVRWGAVLVIAFIAVGVLRGGMVAWLADDPAAEVQWPVLAALSGNGNARERAHFADLAFNGVLHRKIRRAQALLHDGLQASPCNQGLWKEFSAIHGITSRHLAGCR